MDGFCFELLDFILRMRRFFGSRPITQCMGKERGSGVWEIVQTHTALTDYAAVNNRLPVLGH